MIGMDTQWGFCFSRGVGMLKWQTSARKRRVEKPHLRSSDRNPYRERAQKSSQCVSHNTPPLNCRFKLSAVLLYDSSPNLQFVVGRVKIL